MTGQILAHYRIIEKLGEGRGHRLVGVHARLDSIDSEPQHLKPESIQPIVKAQSLGPWTFSSYL